MNRILHWTCRAVDMLAEFLVGFIAGGILGLLAWQVITR